MKNRIYNLNFNYGEFAIIKNSNSLPCFAWECIYKQLCKLVYEFPSKAWELEKPIDKKLSPYLKYVLVSPLIQKQIKPKGATLKHLYLKDLRKFIIPIAPMKAQQTIVKKLDTLSEQTKKLESIYQQKLNDLDELKKSILQKAFNGELT